MPQVRFYALSMNFQVIRNYDAAKNLQGFIFQPEIVDPTKRKDEYILVTYPLLTNNTFDPEFELTQEASDIQVNSMLMLGNIYFGGQKLQKFIASDKIIPITTLYFTPVRKGKHVGYKVKAIPERSFIEQLLEEELNPSPPATPGFG